MRLWRLLLRQWRLRPGRALATVGSVAVAVGAVVATWVSADASRAGYRRLTETVEGVPSIDVSAVTGGRFDVGLLPRLADVGGVRAVVPLFYRPTLLRVGEKRVREIAVGVDAENLVAIGLLTLVAGRACSGPDEIILDQSLAASLERSVDDEVILFVRRGVRRVTVTGIAESQSLKWFAEGAGVVADIAALAEMSNALGLVDRARVVVESATVRPSALAAVAARLPPELVGEVPAGRSSMAEDMLLSANLGLDFVTGLTVAMAWFIVGNAMLMNVSERRRQLSLVRVLGATARQVQRFIVGEAAILGGVGALLGAVGGLAAAGPIAAGISRALQAPVSTIEVRPAVVPVAIALGTLVAMAAGWWPARQAAAIDPLEGLSQAPAPPARGVPWRMIAAALLLWAVAAGVLGLVLSGRVPPRTAVPAGIAMMLAFVATTPLILPAVARLAARVIPARWRLERTLALEQILRQPVRTALTTGVMVVAVSNGIGLGHAIRDNVDDVLRWYARLLRADWVLSHAGVVANGMKASGPTLVQAEEDVKAIPGVDRVEGIGIATGRANDNACVIVACEVHDGEPLPVDPVGIDDTTVRAALERGEALAGTALARRTGIKAGDEVAVEVYGRTTRMRIAALVVDYTSGGSSLVMRRDVARRMFGFEAADILLVKAAPGRAADLKEPLAAVAEKRTMLLRSFGELKQFIDFTVGGIVASLQSILFLGFVVGSLGVANTVTMNVLEKRRTLGLLRAVGMTSRQVTRMVVIESVILGIVGGLLGTLGGLVTALYIQFSSQPLLGHPVRMSFRPGVIIANVLAAILVTALAAWIPARRAARLDLLQALSAE